MVNFLNKFRCENSFSRQYTQGGQRFIALAMELLS
jgi:hypothetical protein